MAGEAVAQIVDPVDDHGEIEVVHLRAGADGSGGVGIGQGDPHGFTRVGHLTIPGPGFAGAAEDLGLIK